MHVFFHASGIPDWPKISLSICKSRPQYSYRWECCDDTIKLSSTNSSTRLLYRGSPFRQLSWCVYVRFVVVHTQMDFTITNPTTQKWPDAQLALASRAKTAALGSHSDTIIKQRRPVSPPWRPRDAPHCLCHELKTAPFISLVIV